MRNRTREVMAFRFRSKGYDLTCAGRFDAHKTKEKVVTVDFNLTVHNKRWGRL